MINQGDRVVNMERNQRIHSPDPPLPVEDRSPVGEKLLWFFVKRRFAVIS